MTNDIDSSSMLIALHEHDKQNVDKPLVLQMQLNFKFPNNNKEQKNAKSSLEKKAELLARYFFTQ